MKQCIPKLKLGLDETVLVVCFAVFVLVARGAILISVFEFFDVVHSATVHVHSISFSLIM